MHDLFVLCVTNIEFNTYLKEFLANYEIISYVNQDHIQKLKEKHKEWTTFFNLCMK